jgi:hypothetical protein
VRKAVDADVKRLLVSAVAIALLAAPASAGASWGPRQTLVRFNGGYAQDVALAGNARGDAVAAWQGSRGVQVAFAHRGKAFGPARELKGGADGSSPQVAIDEQGNALVLWSYFDNTDPGRPGQRDDGCCFGIRLSVRSAKTGRYRRAQTLTPPRHQVNSLAYAIEGGSIGVTWSQTYSPRIHARFGRPGHRLGHRIPGDKGSYPIGLALLRSGPAVTYVEAGYPRVRLHQFRVRHGRAVGSRRVSRTFSSNGYMAAVTNARGQQAVAWTSGDYPDYRLYAGVRSVGDSFRIRRVSGAAPAFVPQPAIARSGAAVLAWYTSTGQILTAGGRPGKPFGPGRPFGKRPKDTYIGAVEVGVNSSGRGVLAWVEAPPGGDFHARGAFRSRGGRPVEARDLGLADNIGQEPPLDARGRARLIWRQRETVKAIRARFP